MWLAFIPCRKFASSVNNCLFFPSSFSVYLAPPHCKLSLICVRQQLERTSPEPLGGNRAVSWTCCCSYFLHSQALSEERAVLQSGGWSPTSLSSTFQLGSYFTTVHLGFFIQKVVITAAPTRSFYCAILMMKWVAVFSMK